MSMYIGVQLRAPDGFEVLAKDCVYHLLTNDARRDRVLLIEFVCRPKRDTHQAKRAKRWTPLPVVRCHVIRRHRFEQALLGGLITRVEPQTAMPPWLGGLSATQLEAHDAQRRRAKQRHDERIDSKLAHMWPLVERAEHVLTADDPFLAIHRHARACIPPQNPTRMRLWFLTYLCFGRNRWALHYPIHDIGRWDRMEKVGRKFGCPSPTRGANAGFGSNDPEMIRKIEAGYREHAAVGRSLVDIYCDSMETQFECATRDDGKGHREVFHPAGEPFPNQEQFMYRVDQRFPLRERRSHKYGAARTRNEFNAPMGPYTESVGSLLERVEADGYVVDEVAEGYRSGSHLPRLVVVRIRCVASGMLVGIGFSVGGERASAYRMAKFCMAIDKVRFCQLFGHRIADTDWPSIGVSPHEIVDRGPGMTADARPRGEAGRPMISEAAPSYMGQSKAIVESSNPRKVKLQGKPTYVTTKMTLPQLAWREITRTLCDNQARDISSRLSNEALIAGVRHSPIDLWRFLEERARTYAIPMAFEDAVRSFLTPVEVKATPSGVRFHNQLYDSEALRETGLHDRVASDQHVPIKAYMLDVCVRHLWVEVAGRLVEVDALLAIADDAEQLYISVKELEQLAAIHREGQRDRQLYMHGEKLHWKQRFKDETGHDFDQGTRKSGRAKRNTSVSVQERNEVLPYLQEKGGHK